MLDDLRNTSSSLYDDDSPTESSQDADDSTLETVQSTGDGRFLGMTPVQRFVLVLVLFLMLCATGFFCLILTEKIVLPF